MKAKEIFITYSWDNEVHCDKVVSFTNFLRNNGFNAEMDRMLIQQESAIDFKQMMHKAITDYKKIIVVLSKVYKEKAEDFRGGVGNEYNLILKDIETNTNKYILITFDEIADEIIPLFFKGRHIIDLSKKDNERIKELFAKLQDIPLYSFVDVATTKPIVKQKDIPEFLSNSNTDISNTTNNLTDNITLEKLYEILSIESDINILELFNLPLTKFIKVSEDLIDANPNDRKNGVTSVYIIDNLNVFGVFDYCVHKIYKNGDKQYFFYTVTDNIQTVLNISKILYSKLGIGLYDNRRCFSFRDEDRVENIAKGYASSEKEECHTSWSLKNNLTVHLNYHVNPLQQLALLIDEKKPVEKTNNVSRRDSILNYINFDIDELVQNSSLFYRTVENGVVKFIDYNANLLAPFLGVFTKIKIRIFSDKKELDENIQTHLFFYTRNNLINSEEIKAVTQSLTSIYGKDDNNSGSIEEYEVKSIEEFSSWLGRRYTFNNEHRLIDYKKNPETSMYEVDTYYDDFSDDGLTLSIIAFNNLVKYMKENF